MGCVLASMRGCVSRGRDLMAKQRRIWISSSRFRNPHRQSVGMFSEVQNFWRAYGSQYLYEYGPFLPSLSGLRLTA
jgi:hypothetical protein